MIMSISTFSFNPALPPRPFARFDFARPVCCFSRCVLLSSKNRFSSKPMSGWVEISPLRSGDGVEGVRALEKDHVLIDGQMDFSPDLASGGLQSTLNRLSKWIVAILFGAYVIWRHDAEAMWAVTGSILNVLLSIALKHTLKQERPVSTSESDHGMPSSHAQSLLYAAVFTVLSLVKYFGMNGATLTIGILTLTMGLYFSWLRVSMRRHTVGQVVVGAIVGSIFSVLWFKSWDAFVLKAFVSHLWVRIVVVLGGAGFCLGFLLYVIRYWLVDEL